MKENKQLRGLLVVPNYNQGKEIENFLDSLVKYWPVEDAVVVDDASTDGSSKMAENRGLQVIYHTKNLGLGAAIRTGIFHAIEKKYDYVLISAANGKMKPEEYSRLAAPILSGAADYTTGNRYLKGGSSPGLTPFRKVAIPIFSVLTSFVLGRYYSDVTCGFRAYKVSIFKDPQINIAQDWLDRYELEYYIHYWATKTGVKIVEVPVTMFYSHLKRGRKSKIIPFLGWWSMIRPFVLLAIGAKK